MLIYKVLSLFTLVKISCDCYIMSSDSLFGFSDKEAVYELTTIFHSTILEILAYGMYTPIFFVGLYLTCMSSCLAYFHSSYLGNLVSRENSSPRASSAVFITIMWILVTIHASTKWAYLNYIYVQHGETREAQLGALLSLQYGELFPVAATNAVATLISILLADMTMVITHSSNLRNHPS